MDNLLTATVIFCDGDHHVFQVSEVHFIYSDKVYELVSHWGQENVVRNLFHVYSTYKWDI